MHDKTPHRDPEGEDSSLADSHHEYTSSPAHTACMHLKDKRKCMDTQIHTHKCMQSHRSTHKQDCPVISKSPLLRDWRRPLKLSMPAAMNSYRPAGKVLSITSMHSLKHTRARNKHMQTHTHRSTIFPYIRTQKYRCASLLSTNMYTYERTLPLLPLYQDQPVYF